MTAQQIIEEAIATECKIYVDDQQADEIYEILRPFLVRGMGCLFRKYGYDIWFDTMSDKDGYDQQFVMARKG